MWFVGIGFPGSEREAACPRRGFIAPESWVSLTLARGVWIPRFWRDGGRPAARPAAPVGVRGPASERSTLHGPRIPRRLCGEFEKDGGRHGDVEQCGAEQPAENDHGDRVEDSLPAHPRKRASGTSARPAPRRSWSRERAAPASRARFIFSSNFSPSNSSRWSSARSS